MKPPAYIGVYPTVIGFFKGQGELGGGDAKFGYLSVEIFDNAMIFY